MTVEEPINPGADVIGSDGEKVGSVAYVVVNPSSMHIEDIVVSTGAILGRDVVVSTDKIERIADNGIYLTLDKGGLEACKDYIDVEYQAPPAEWAPAGGFSAYPTGMTLFPAGMYFPEASDVTVNTPPGTVGLHEGMDVTSSEGDKIGTIQSFEADPATGNITELVVKHGFISTHEATIAAEHVRAIESDRVRLDLPKDELEQLFDK
jgi:sporulation protein YlmC with PRC-barrel domain